MPHLDEEFREYEDVCLENEPIIMNYTAIQVKDITASLEFYHTLLEMKPIKIIRTGDLYYYMLSPKEYPIWTEQMGVLTLIYQPGTEKDPDLKVDNSKVKKKGFGNLYFSGDVHQTGRVLSRMGRQNLTETVCAEGFMETFKFTDPDGYQIIWNYNMDTSCGDVSVSMLSRIMIRVENPVECVEFYRNVLGMKLYVRRDDEKLRTTSYFLGYLHDQNPYAFNPFNFEGSMDMWDIHFRCGIIELQHSWDTSETFDNHQANVASRGFSHFGFSLIDVQKFCDKLEAERGAKLDWTTDTNEEGNTETRVKMKDPEGNAIHFISRGYFTERIEKNDSESAQSIEAFSDEISDAFSDDISDAFSDDISE